MTADPPYPSRRLLTSAAMALMALAWSGAATASPIAFDQPQLQSPVQLQVTVPGLTDGGALPANYTANGRNLSPPVSWSGSPPQTRSFVVLMQDADLASTGGEPDAAVNWLAYAIPPNVSALARGLRNVASPSNPLGSSQGRNAHDSLGYTGPRLAVGEPAHHYHLQVFALDLAVRTHPGAGVAAVLRAMAGHVVARGEVVATYVAPAPDLPHGKAKGMGAPVAPSP